MKVKQHILQVSVLLFLVFLTMLSVSQTFAYWASSTSGNSDQSQGTISIGDWAYLTEAQISTQDLQDCFDALIAANDPYIEGIYDETLVVDGTSITMSAIMLEGHEWEILGIGKIPTNGKAPRIGFVQLIDRTLDGVNIPIHPILPPAPIDPPPYPEFSYFNAYDVLNTLTNNVNSIRLNYEVELTLTNPLSNVTNVSFYAYRGLHSSSDLNTFGRLDDYTLATTRTFAVSVSADGTNWTVIGSGTPGFTTNQSAAFNFYSFDIPSQFLNQSIYIRIYYNGATIKTGGTIDYSRLVIDELVITQ